MSFSAMLLKMSNEGLNHYILTLFLPIRYRQPNLLLDILNNVDKVLKSRGKRNKKCI